MADETRAIDIFGVKPLSDTVRHVTTSAVDGMGALLGRICLPASEELGLYLRDRVKLWAARNLSEIARVAQEKLDAVGNTAGHNAHPRVVWKVLAEGTWADDPDLQSMWGGLLASSCTPDGLDDSNVLFQDGLSGLTGLQARIIKFSCERAQKFASASGFALAYPLIVSTQDLCAEVHVDDIQRLDRELDRLGASGLLAPNSGFDATAASTQGSPQFVGVTPSPLALHLYVRCQGSRLSPIEYFGITEIRVGITVHGFSQQSVIWQEVKPEVADHET